MSSTPSAQSAQGGAPTSDPPAYEAIRYALEPVEHSRLAVITLHRPDKMNAMDARMRAELADAFRRASDEARAILLQAAPNPVPEGPSAFCAGQDLGDIRDTDLERSLVEEYGPMLSALAKAPIPSVCVVEGVAAGAGLHLALSADILIAAHSARFVAPFSRIGLIPAGAGSYWLPRVAGPRRATAMVLLGEPVPAETAVAWGLATEAVADAEARTRGRALAERLALGPTKAFALAKTALRDSLTTSFDAQLALEAKLQGEAGRTRDYQEGVAAFLEKRRPQFEGR